MALLEIITFPDPILREKCTPVESIDDEIRELVEDMVETMYDAPGIGLAAPQIGCTERIIVIDVGEDVGSEEEPKKVPNLHKLINPEIVSRTGTTTYEEGCLSLPGVQETVERAAEVVVEALNPEGEKVTIEANGLLAICLQHEIDHLDGVLILDHISRLKRNMIIPKLKKRKK